MKEGRRFAIVVAIITLGALCLRVVPLYERVMAPDAVRFQEVDAYYHVRLAELLVAHYPHRPTFDPYRLHPNGQGIDVHPLQDHLVASVALVAGLGAPSERTIHVVAAWIPPLLGALTVLLVGLLGRRVGGDRVGWASAYLAAVIPGGTLSQSVLGYADHHALESALVALVLWSTTEAIVLGSARRSIGFWALNGAGVALYALTWVGGPGLAAVLLVCVVAWLVSADLSAEGQRTALTGSLTAAVAGWAVLAVGRWWVPPVQVTAGMLALLPILPLSLRAVRSVSVIPSGLSRWVWLASIIAIASLALLLAPPALLGPLATDLARFWPSDEARTVSELRPLMDTGEGAWRQVWEFYVGVPVAAAAALLMLAMRWRRSGRLDGHAVVTVVAGAMLIPAAFLQVRFGAAAAIPMVVLASLSLLPLIEPRRKGLRWLTRAPVRWALLALWMLALPVAAIPKAWAIATLDRGPDAAWSAAMDWLRTQTPEPFDGPDRYLGDGTDTLRSSYGVACWWDAGYYVQVLGRRVPTSNPTQAGAHDAARLLLESDPEAVRAYLDGRRIRYLIVDARLPITPVGPASYVGKFPALEAWAGLRDDSLRATWFVAGTGGRPEPRLVYPPEYFRTLAVRLTLFGNERVRPGLNAVWLVRTELATTNVGERVTRIVAAESYPSYEQAEGILRTRTDGTWRIVSQTPLATSVPLEPIEGLHEVFRSREVAYHLPSNGGPVPYVRIFERRENQEEVEGER